MISFLLYIVGIYLTIAAMLALIFKCRLGVTIHWGWLLVVFILVSLLGFNIGCGGCKEKEYV